MPEISYADNGNGHYNEFALHFMQIYMHIFLKMSGNT